MGKNSGCGCACLKVVYSPRKHENGTIEENWKCELCGSSFIREVLVPDTEKQTKGGNDSE